MRILLAVATLLVSSLALAYPSIGDQATYIGSISGEDGKSEFSVTNTITGWDQDTQEFLIRSETIADGRTTTEDKRVGKDDMVTPAGIEQLLAACSENGGQLGSVSTPAGTFDSCVVTSEDSGVTAKYAFANVPFGIVALEMKAQGMQIIMKPQSMALGGE